jgi:ectoine hydroxylase-related dioxygenase (phytanoyl-CoA dioxygenase family)
VLLTVDQLESYDRNGYFVLPNYFSAAEIEILTAEIPAIFSEATPRRITEKSGAVRSVFGSHMTNEVYGCFSRLPRMINPAIQILGGDVYIHQFKINAKVAFEGDQWEWHQDFLYWHKEDSMPTPRVLTAVLFLQEVNEFNGPMLVIPGSHKEGMIDISLHRGDAPNGNGNGHGNGDGNGHAHPGEAPPAWFSTLTADLKYKIDRYTLSKLVERNNIQAIKCPAGSVMLFHGNLLHASANNLSPWDRMCVFVTYNSVENRLLHREDPRPEFIAYRDFTPLMTAMVNDLSELKMEAR